MLEKYYFSFLFCFLQLWDLSVVVELFVHSHYIEPKKKEPARKGMKAFARRTQTSRAPLYLVPVYYF